MCSRGGSCTCNLLTPDGYDVANAYLKDYDNSDYATKTMNQANRLQELFKGPDVNHYTFEVVLGLVGLI